MENIEYDCLKQRFGTYREDLDEIVELLVETVCAKRKTTRIAGADFPHEVVRSRFLKLDSSHIEFVMAGVIAIVLIGGYIVIQSIFRISINDKIRSYGQLRTIGATPKQIKRIVKREGRKLGSIGILIGTVLGVCAGFLLFSKGFNAVSYVIMIWKIQRN